MTGFGPIFRLAWRRNRIYYLFWVLGTSMLMPLTVTKYHDLVPPGTNAEAMMTLLGNDPVMRAILGPPFDLMQPGGFTFFRVGTFTAAAVAMMAAYGVIRSTRADEELGRDELIRSGSVARHVPLLAAVALALVACFAIFLITVAGMTAAGTPLAGAVASGLGLALTGAMWAGVAAVFSQVFESARTVRYWAVGIALGGGYLLRGMIDGSGAGSSLEPLHWLVPLEWAALARPYADERWWVFALPLALTAVLLALAFWLEARRDYGAGLVAAKPGRAVAPAYLSGAWGLSWRLQRGGMIGWTIALLASGLSMGTLAGGIDDMVANNAQLAEMFRKMGGGAPDLKMAFFLAMLSIFVTVIAVFALILLSRLRAEENLGHAEVMLATSTTRWSYAFSHLLPAVLVPVLVLIASGALIPLGDAIGTGDYATVWGLTKGALVFIAGLVLVVGIGMALIGWLPRAFPIAWGVLGWSMFASWLGPLFEFPDWLLKAHPWGHLPHLPAEAMSWAPVLIELGIGLALIVLGLIGYRRRDIAGV